MVKCKSCEREVMEHDAICVEDGNWFCLKCVAELHAEVLNGAQSALMRFSNALNLAADAFNSLTEAWNSFPHEVTVTFEEEAEQQPRKGSSSTPTACRVTADNENNSIV